MVNFSICPTVLPRFSRFLAAPMYLPTYLGRPGERPRTSRARDLTYAPPPCRRVGDPSWPGSVIGCIAWSSSPSVPRSEEHTSELQSRENLVCRLLLEKKNKSNAP